MNKIVAGLKDAIRFAKGEPVNARVTHYPADGGLPEQVRSYDETEGVGALLRKTFFADKR